MKVRGPDWVIVETLVDPYWHLNPGPRTSENGAPSEPDGTYKGHCGALVAIDVNNIDRPGCPKCLKHLSPTMVKQFFGKWAK